MKQFVILLLLPSVFGKPRLNPALKFADGRIIGGEEAPKRELHTKIFEFMLLLEVIANIQHQ